MRILALDIGDRWTGSAISDPLGILSRPYETVKTGDLVSFLKAVIEKERIGMVVVGLPTTMRGTESDQTKKVQAQVEGLRQLFTNVEWKLWDERLTSKQASGIQSAKTKEEKIRSHSLAAALILRFYLDYKRMQEDFSRDANHDDSY